MLDNKLLRYYERIADQPIGQDVSLSLQQIADLFFTSVRYARTLLNAMQAEDWLIWQPKVGRSNKSILQLNYTLAQLQQQLACQFIQQGKYQQALALIGHDKQIFGQLLAQTSGAVQREDSLHIQLTYSREFSALFPHHTLRNSERFFIRQLYSCLVTCDADGHIKSGLAHCWQYDAVKMQWLFYLRPQLSFHDATCIDAAAVVDLLQALQVLAEYQQELAHVERVYTVNSLCVGFQLTQADPGFAALLADMRYSIQPAEQVQLQVSLLDKHVPVGSGAFKVQDNSLYVDALSPQPCLRLQAFEHYYACRALTDSVTVWQVVDDTRSDISSFQKRAQTSTPKAMPAQGAICSHYLSLADTKPAEEENKRELKYTKVQKEDEATASQHSRTEDGCLLMLFNQNDSFQSAILTLQQRHFLSELLQPKHLMHYLEQQQNSTWGVIAKNIVPQWIAAGPSMIDSGSESLKEVIKLSATLSLPKKIDIAVFDHSALLACADVMVELLAQVDVKCELQHYSFNEFQLQARAKNISAELVLTSVNLDDNRASSAFRWFYSNSVLQQCLSAQGQAWLQTKLVHIRQSHDATDYLTALEPIATGLIYQHQLLPLFHHKQTLNFAGMLKGVAISCWGWPLIKDVWAAD